MMKIKKHLLLFPFSLTLGLVTTGLQAAAYTVPETPPSSWNKGSFGVQTQSEYFFSHANYGQDRGSYETLLYGNKFASFENRIKARFGFTDRISIYAGFGVDGTQVTDGSTAPVNASGNLRSNSTANELFAGLDFALARRWWRVIPEIEGSYSLDSPTRLQTQPLTSDGASYMNAGVFFFKPYRYLRFEGYLGFHIPGDDLAKKFMYQVGAEIAMFGAFTLGGGVRGYETVIADNTSNTERQLTIATSDGLSDRFRSYSPALLEANGWIGLRFDRAFGLRLGYAKTLNGVRAAEGQSVLLSLYYNSPGRVPHDPMRVPVAPKGDRFKTEPEPNDPELYEPGEDNSLDNAERLFDHK